MASNEENRQVLTALSIEAERFQAANEKLQQARVEFELSARRFAAVRDMATEYLKSFPYNKAERELWPNMAPVGQEYRFVLMTPGDSVIEVLREAGEPLSAPVIMHRIAQGGGALLQGLSLRGVTAAVSRLDRVEQFEGERFQLKDKVDVDDLPFE